MNPHTGHTSMCPPEQTETTEQQIHVLAQPLGTMKPVLRKPQVTKKPFSENLIKLTQSEIEKYTKSAPVAPNPIKHELKPLSIDYSEIITNQA